MKTLSYNIRNDTICRRNSKKDRSNILKNTRRIIIIIVCIIFILIGVYYIAGMPILTENKALDITEKYIESDFILEHTFLLNKKHYPSLTESYNDISGNYYWSILYKTPEGHSALFNIDARTGDLIEGSIFSESETIYRFNTDEN